MLRTDHLYYQKSIISAAFILSISADRITKTEAAIVEFFILSH
jgi:hypothetical protein